MTPKSILCHDRILRDIHGDSIYIPEPSIKIREKLSHMWEIFVKDKNNFGDDQRGRNEGETFLAVQMALKLSI